MNIAARGHKRDTEKGSPRPTSLRARQFSREFAYFVCSTIPGSGGLSTGSLRRVRSGQQNEDLNKCMSTTYFVEFTAFVSVHFGSFKISFLQVISRQEKISRTEFSHGHNLLNKQQHAVI